MHTVNSADNMQRSRPIQPPTDFTGNNSSVTFFLRIDSPLPVAFKAKKPQTKQSLTHSRGVYEDLSVPETVQKQPLNAHVNVESGGNDVQLVCHVKRRAENIIHMRTRETVPPSAHRCRRCFFLFFSKLASLIATTRQDNYERCRVAL